MKRRSTPSSNDAYDLSRRPFSATRSAIPGSIRIAGSSRTSRSTSSGSAGRELEREPATEGVADPDRGLGADARHERVEVLVDAPRRLVG